MTISWDRKAPLQIVVYSDPECPYCKSFHETLQKINAEYGKTGQVAIVYRLLPIESLHSKAKTEVHAALCAGKIGGNTAFWAYMDKVFAATPSNDRLDLNLLPTFAKEIGLDSKKFAACQKDGNIDNLINAQILNANAVGISGTPFPVIFYKGELKGALPGALPFEQTTDKAGNIIPGMKTIIEEVLNSK